jgi:hypothetical protein
MDIFELIDNARANGGGTYKVEDRQDEYNFEPLTLTSGYYVALAGGIERAGNLYLNPLTEFLLGFDLDSEHLGLWRDEDGLWSLDRTVWFLDRESAVEFGKLQHQRAIWDIANGVAITL